MNKRREMLVNLRKNKKWTQKDVVSTLQRNYDVKISESYYGMIEQGVRTPSLSLALAISELFNIRPEDIFFEDEPYKKLFLKLKKEVV